MAAVDSVSRLGDGDQSALRRFRDDLYDCLAARADALFELVDGLCSPIPVDGVAHVTLAAGCRRGHGAAYAALSHGRIDADLLRDVLAAHRPVDWPADFAVDVTTWARCDGRMLARPGLLLPPVAALGRPADRGRLALSVDRRTVSDTRFVDRADGHDPAGRGRQHQHRGGATGACPAATT
jgi:hypothetical protein